MAKYSIELDSPTEGEARLVIRNEGDHVIGSVTVDPASGGLRSTEFGLGGAGLLPGWVTILLRKADLACAENKEDK